MLKGRRLEETLNDRQRGAINGLYCYVLVVKNYRSIIPVRNKLAIAFDYNIKAGFLESKEGRIRVYLIPDAGTVVESLMGLSIAAWDTVTIDDCVSTLSKLVYGTAYLDR